MEVLKPDVYWLGNRCYRINPCPNSQNQFLSFPEDGSSADGNKQNAGMPKPYVEADDFEDAVTNLEENPDSVDENVKVVQEDTGFKIICNVPNSLFPHIIGSKGAVKKRIELETKTRIYVPRQNEKGDIVIRGQFERDVRRGFKRVEQIAMNARFKREATHFTCFPMNNEGVIKKAKEFKEKVLKDCEMTARGLEASIFQGPEKLHLTISVLMLLDERERRAAAEILSSVEDEIKEIVKAKGKLQICLKGLEIMNDDPTQVDVMYAKCEAVDGTNTSTVQQIADAIAHKFAEKGFGKESRGEKVKLHCTLINTRYRSENSKSSEGVQDSSSGRRPPDNANFKRRNNDNPGRESFDARLILQKYGGFEFGIVEVSEVKLATRHTTANDGFYKCYASLPL